MAAQKGKIEELLVKARAGQFPAGVNFVLPSPEVAELMATFPFEWFIVDQEHTPLNGGTTVVAMGQALTASGKPWIVKLNEPNPLLARDAMDAGSYGIMVPFIHSAKQLNAFMSEVRFAPKGNRGFCSLSRATAYGIGKMAKLAESVTDAYIDFVNEEMLVIPTVESLEAVENLDELLALDEFECWHVGVEDLIMSGTNEGYDMRWGLSLSRTVAKKMREAGKLVIIGGAPQAREDALARFETFYVDMPYAPDSLVLGYGCAETISNTEAAAETLGQAKKQADVG